jgi:hypothetical protein
MPMESESRGKQSLDARVWEWVVSEQGWGHTDQGDFCPDHNPESTKPSPFPNHPEDLTEEQGAD